MKKFGIKFPVVLDNSYGTWNAYGNQYWPHKYLIDIDGYVVYDHIGEGGYMETEDKIVDLLKERAYKLGLSGSISKSEMPEGVLSITGRRSRIIGKIFLVIRKDYFFIVFMFFFFPDLVSDSRLACSKSKIFSGNHCGKDAADTAA